MLGGGSVFRHQSLIAGNPGRVKFNSTPDICWAIQCNGVDISYLLIDSETQTVGNDDGNGAFAPTEK